MDGWWTTKVAQDYKGLGGVATSVGIQVGVLLGFSVYIKLEHAFPHIITLERFFLFLAAIFLVSTILILIFADEGQGSATFFRNIISETSMICRPYLRVKQKTVKSPPISSKPISKFS